MDQASSQDSDETPEYAFAGVNLMPVAIQALTLELFSGQVAKRDAIAENVRKTHLERGGTDSNAADYPSVCGRSQTECQRTASSMDVLS